MHWEGWRRTRPLAWRCWSVEWRNHSSSTTATTLGNVTKSKFRVQITPKSVLFHVTFTRLTFFQSCSICWHLLRGPNTALSKYSHQRFPFPNSGMGPLWRKSDRRCCRTENFGGFRFESQNGGRQRALQDVKVARLEELMVERQQQVDAQRFRVGRSRHQTRQQVAANGPVQLYRRMVYIRKGKK